MILAQELTSGSMSWQAWYTALVIAVFVAALASRRMGADVASICALAALLVAGVLDPGEAVAGFANPAVITVGLLYIVAQGLKETGAMISVTRPLLGQPRNIIQAQPRLAVPVAVASAFVNNTPIVAMFLPVLSGWARRNQLDPSKLFMPLSFAAILGGMCTLIGTSTNIVVNELLREHNPDLTFHMFTLAWVGVPASAAGLIYMLILSNRWLPSGKRPMSPETDPREFTVWMRVLPTSPIAGRTIEQAGLRHLSGLYLAEIEREDELLLAVGPQQLIRGGDRLRFVGLVESVIELQQIRGLEPDTDQIHKLDQPRTRRRLTEAVISESSPLVGRSVRESGFRTQYNAVIIAVHRAGERLKKKIGDVVLRPGDTLLLEAPEGFAEQHRNSSAFYLVSELPTAPALRWHLSGVALAILVGLVAAITLGWLDVMTGALCAAALMIVTRCCTGTQARSAVNWQVLIVIGSAFGIATAMEKSGLAGTIGQNVLGWTAEWGAYGLLAGVFVITCVFTAIMTNNSAAVLMFPIAYNAAETAGIPFLPVAVCLAIGASSAFVTPLGYQTNMMVMGPGGYTWGDFFKFGFPLTIIVGVICVCLAPTAYM